MKRDLDLIRTILLEIEKNDNPLRSIPIEAVGYASEEISYHVMLLAQAGYISADNVSHMRGIVWKPKSLTWAGHEFLDATRNGKVWNQVKAKLKDQAIDAPLTLIQQLATKLVAQVLGLGD
jgi:hypothetical protein